MGDVESDIAAEPVGDVKTLTDPVGGRPGPWARFYIFVVGHPRYRSRRKVEMPRRARVYIAAIATLGSVALALTLWLDWGEPVHRWWLLILFALYAIFDRNLQFSHFRGGAEGVGVRLEEGTLVAMALLFPPWVVLLAFLLSGLVAMITRDSAYVRSIFNNGHLMISIAASLGVMRLVGLHPLQPFGARSFLAVIAGGLTFLVISNSAVATVVALVQRRPVVNEIVNNFAGKFWYFFLASMSLGVLVGIVALYSIWGLLAAAAATLMLIIALRDRTSAMTERERMVELLDATRRMHSSVVSADVREELEASAKSLMRCELIIITTAANESLLATSISASMHGAMEGYQLLAAEKQGNEYWSVADQQRLDALAHIGSSALTNAISYEQAEAERRKLADVLNFSSDAILVTDPDGRVVGWNPAMTALVGMNEEQARGRSLTELATLEPRFTALFSASLDPVEIVEIERESTAAQQALSVARSRMPDGSSIAVARDESARLELERLKSEREAEKLRSELVSMVSHELRTPLTSIIGFSQFLLKREVSREDSQRYLDTIYTEAKRLSELLNDFLDLQRVKEGRFTMEIAPFDLGATAAEVVSLFAQQSEIHRLHLGAEPSIIVDGDRTRIRQVIANLVSNAIKYSPEGGDVHVSVDRVDGQGRLEVADQGLGIPTEAKASLFTKFYRIAGSDRAAIGGTGLGLALCKEIIDAHDGKIGVDSEPGQGARFWFEIVLDGQSSAASE